MEAPLKINDQVRYKAGGPAMTIAGIYSAPDKTEPIGSPDVVVYDCRFYSEEKKETISRPYIAVELTKLDPQ